MAAIVKPGRQRRLAGARLAHECEGLSADRHGIGVKREKRALVEQRAECRPEQEQADVAQIAARAGFDDDSFPATDAKPGDIGDRITIAPSIASISSAEIDGRRVRRRS